MTLQQNIIPPSPSQTRMNEASEEVLGNEGPVIQPATDSRSPRCSGTFAQADCLPGTLKGSREFVDSSDGLFGPINNAFDMHARGSTLSGSIKKCPSSLLAQSCTLHDDNEGELDEGANTEVMSPTSVEYVSDRLRKMEFPTAEIVQITNETVELISPDELLPEQPPLLSLELPSLEWENGQNPIKQFVNQIKNQHQLDKKIIHLRTQDNPISQRNAKKQNTQRVSSFSERIEAANLISEPGKLIMRMQSIELQPVKSIPTNKSIENGHLIAFVSLGNQTFDVVSNPIVCLDNADPRALFDQIDSEFDASITKNDTLTITVYFQDQDSLKGKKFKKLRHMVQNFMHKKKPTENSLYPVPSTLSTLSTVSTRTTGRHSEVLIGKTDISIRTGRFSELFSGKILEMDVRFDENEWIKGLKITCCFVPNSDVVECGFPKRIPKNLVEGAEFIEYRNVMRSVNYECLLSVKKSTESCWKREICQFRGYRIFCFDKVGVALKRVIDLRHLTFVSDANEETTGRIPKQFRLYLNQTDAAYVDFLASSQNDYNCCMDQLKLIQKTFAIIQKPQNLQLN